jgi:hypothetical protein
VLQFRADLLPLAAAAAPTPTGAATTVVTVPLVVPQPAQPTTTTTMAASFGGVAVTTVPRIVRLNTAADAVVAASMLKPVMSTLTLVSPGEAMTGARAVQFESSRGSTTYRIGFRSVREFKLRGVDYVLQCDVEDSGSGPLFRLTLGGQAFFGTTPTEAVRNLCDYLGIELVRPVAQFLGLYKFQGEKGEKAPLSPQEHASVRRVELSGAVADANAPRRRRRAALGARKVTMMLLGQDVADDDDEVDHSADGDELHESQPAPSQEHLLAVSDSHVAAPKLQRPDRKRQRSVRFDAGSGDDNATTAIGSGAANDDEFDDDDADADDDDGDDEAEFAESSDDGERVASTRATRSTAPAGDLGDGDDEFKQAPTRGGRPSDGGLRTFASLVARFVHSQGKTTFADVADAVVATVKAQEVFVNDNNARRRVYDVLNVLQSVGIVAKEKKTVAWIGVDESPLGAAGSGHFEVPRLPSPLPPPPVAAPKKRAPGAAGHRAALAAAQAALAERKRQIRETIEKKGRRVNELYNYRVRLQNLLNRNAALMRARAAVSRAAAPADAMPSERIELPFILAHSRQRVVIDCEATSELSEVLLSFSLPFTLVDDVAVLEQMHRGGVILWGKPSS